MAPSCKHSASLSDIHSVEYGGVDAESSKCDLSFRPGTKLSLVLTKKPEREAPRVKIAIEGPTENLRGKIWYPSEKDGEIDTTRWNVQLNTEYRVPLALKHRVFCKLWTDDCPLCKADAEQKADYEEVFQTFLSQLKQSENRLSEQRLQAKNLQKALESRIRQLKQAAVDNERKLAEVLQENETLKEENKGMRSQVFNFKHKEERQNAVVGWPLLPAEFSSWRQEAYVTDFFLVVDGKRIPVHRPVLALKSAYFETFFRTHPQAAEFLVKGFSARAIYRVLVFVYGERLDELDGDAREQYAAARRYAIPDLLAACIAAMKASISKEYVAHLLVLAVSHDDRELGDFAVDFADANDGKFALLAAAPIQAFKHEPATFKKIWECINHERMDGGQPPPRSPVDNAEGHFDSSSSSGWEPVDAN